MYMYVICIYILYVYYMYPLYEIYMFVRYFSVLSSLFEKVSFIVFKTLQMTFWRSKSLVRKGKNVTENLFALFLLQGFAKYR